MLSCKQWRRPLMNNKLYTIPQVKGFRYTASTIPTCIHYKNVKVAQIHTSNIETNIYKQYRCKDQS